MIDVDRWLPRATALLCGGAVVSALMLYQQRHGPPDIAPERIRPYAALRVVWGSVYEVRGREGHADELGSIQRERWSLLFSIDVIDKRSSCRQVEWQINVQEQGKSVPVAQITFNSPQVAPPNLPVTRLDGLTMPLERPLAPANHVLNVQSTCFIETSSGLEPLAPLANAPAACFLALPFGPRDAIMKLESVDCPKVLPLASSGL